MEVKAPSPISTNTSARSLFLAGTIDMGNSKDWQAEAVAELSDHFVIIFNPRRDAWDSSWEQHPSNEQFNEQVNWELDRLEQSSHVLFNFEPNSKSPITLMELGERLASRGRQVLVVVCSEKFYRYGNVAIICERYGVPVFDNLAEAYQILKEC